MIYSLPLATTSLGLWVEAIRWDRDFLVPLVWGLVIPWWNTREPAGKPWVFKDFQARDCFPPSIALLHAAVWSLAIHFTSNAFAAALSFAFFFLVFDALLIHYRLLCIYALPWRIQQRGAVATVATFGIAWWGALATGLAFVHLWGDDSPFSMTIAALALIVPAQAGISLFGRLAAPAERLDGVRRVAVIGGGWNGLYATKALLEHGLEAVCFDENADLGGIWRFRPERGGVFAETRATSSKHFLHASDFPFAESAGDFPQHEEVLGWLRSYTEHFSLKPALRFNTRVLSTCRAAPNGSSQPTWTLRVARHDRRPPDPLQADREDRLDSQPEEHLFDALVVCSGPQGQPRVDPAKDDLFGAFTGSLTAAVGYKSPAEMQPGERILVVGAGESAADIVAECAAAGHAVHWSVRSGQWFADRHIGPHPADHFTAFGLRTLLGRFLNTEYIVRRLVIGRFIDLAWGRGGHGIDAWVPKIPYLHQYLNKSRDAVRAIYWGRARAHGAIAAIAGNEVSFASGEKVIIDRLVLATGYKPHWPFLTKPPTALYKLVFDPSDPRLAFVGFARPTLGSIPSLGEAQARWVARVLSGEVCLPAAIRRHVRLQQDALDHRRRMDDRSVLGNLVDQENYAAQVAAYGGFGVPWWRLALRPAALWATLRSPWIAFKYRLGDTDPRTRQTARLNIVRELPHPSHPAFLLFRAMLCLSFLAAAGLIAAAWWLPAATLLAAAAVGAFLFGGILRLTDPYTPRNRAAQAASPTVASPRSVSAPSA